MIGRRTLLGGILAGAALRPAWAGRPLDLLVGAAAGAPQDQAARAFAPFLERHLPHVRVTVLNCPGEAGLTALRALAAAPPTGQVLGWLGTPTLPARMVDHTGGAAMLGRLMLLGAVAREPIALVSSSDSPLASAAELIRRAAENAEAMPLATPPAGSAPHLAALRLQAVAGTALNIVAFPSAAAARQAAQAMHAAAAVLGLGDAIEGLRGGTLTGLGIASRDRADVFPDMPPLRESGLNLSAVIRRGLAAPAALPASLADPLRAALHDVVSDPEFRAQADAAGFIASWSDGPAWTDLAVAEHADLAALWQAAPWLASGMG